MTHPKAIIFDLDGTLIHSAPDLQSATNVALAALDRQPLDLPTVISFIGNGVEKLIERALNATGGNDALLHQTALGLFLESYNQNMTALTRPYPGVLAALGNFRQADIPLGICTNKPTAPARGICDALGLSHYFDVITGAGPELPKKPEPQMLIACCDQLGVCPEDALYVGDSAIDYHTARNASIGFRLYAEGYLNHPLPDLPDGDRFSDWAAHGISCN